MRKTKLNTTVAHLGASESGRRTTIGTGAADPLYEFVTQGLDAILKLLGAGSTPTSTVGTGYSIRAGESNIQDVGWGMSVVTVNRITEAKCGERDGSFADHGFRIVVAIAVTPNAIILVPLASRKT